MARSSVDDDKVLETIFNPEHPIMGLQLSDAPTDSLPEDDIPNLHEIKALETAAVKLAEGDDLTGALDALNEVITLSPNYASVYNNRAQIYRLLNRVDEALSDLNTAITLSRGKGKTAEQAYTQRGLILMLRGNEDEALQDFKVAASLGSKFAQTQLVKLNPYSKLCNQMLSEAMDKLQGK